MTIKRKLEPSRRKQKSKTSFIKKERSSQYFMLWGMIIVYMVVFTYLSILRYESYQTSAYDLGTMIQVIWNTSKGWILQDSINMGYPMTRFWMAHWEFIFILIAVIFKIIPHPYTILILQTSLIALGALPLYKLGRLITHDKSTALTFAFAYLMYPAIQNANLADVHGVTLAAPFLAFTFYYLVKKKFKLFYLFAFLSLTSREDSALILVMLGIYSVLVLKEKKHGLIVAVVSALWFLIWFERLKIRALLGLPEFNIMAGADTHWSHLRQWSQDPFYLFKFWAKKYNIYYFIYIFAPVVFLSFFEWKVLFIGAPIFAVNMISNYYYTHDVEHYYSTTVAPFVFISAIYGLQKVYEFFHQKLNRRFKEKSIRENVLSIAATMVFISAIVFFFIKSNALDFRHWKISAHHRVINETIKMIPGEASLSAESRLIPQAARRHHLYVFNDNVGQVDYVLWDFYAPSTHLVTRSSFHLPYFWPNNDSILAMLRNIDYGIIHYDDGVCLFKKGANYEQGVRELSIDVGSAIETFSKKEITPAIEFMGYNEFPLLKAYHPIENSEAIKWKYAIHYTSFWSTKEKLTQDYQIVFKYQHGDQIFYQAHEPVFGIFPTTRWQPNEIIKDEIFWEVPDGATSGQYEILVAFTEPGVIDFAKPNFIKLFDLSIEIPKEE